MVNNLLFIRNFAVAVFHVLFGTVEKCKHNGFFFLDQVADPDCNRAGKASE